MEKSLFEEMGGTYRQMGDYLLPELALPEEKEIEIGVWGQRHWRYLKEHRRATYYSLLISGKLNEHLAEIDRLVEQYAAAEGVIEDVKAADQMAWVGAINNICNRAEEIVLRELVYEEVAVWRFKEFWYSNIELTEYDATPSKEYKELLQRICRNEGKLPAAFTDEQKDLFSRYVACVQDFQAMADCLLFQSSFRLGARMMVEVMDDK